MLLACRGRFADIVDRAPADRVQIYFLFVISRWRR